MAWYWLGDEWLDDSIAAAMRSWLNDGVPSGPAIQLNSSMDVNGMLRSINIAPDSHHFAFIVTLSGQPMVVIGMLGVHILGVRVSEKAYPIPQNDALLLDAVGRMSNETSQSELFGKSIIAVYDNDSPS